MKTPVILNSVPEAIEDIRQGKIIIVVDDENRENEGDMIAASECMTPELVNFMVKKARGLLCVAVTAERCRELNLELMVKDNTALHQTAFTASVDLIGYGCTTGVSAHDRAKTINALVDPSMKAREFASPGHIFPLIANPGGLLARDGHTEAAVELARLAGWQPSGVLIEVLNEDGSMARLPQLVEIAEEHNLKIISIENIIGYIRHSQIGD